MAITQREMEGTWEEIAAHAEEWRGRRVRLTVLEPEKSELPVRHKQMLEAWQRYKSEPLSDEDLSVWGDFEQFHKEHPFELKRLDEGEDE